MEQNGNTAPSYRSGNSDWNTFEWQLAPPGDQTFCCISISVSFVWCVPIKSQMPREKGRSQQLVPWNKNETRVELCYSVFLYEMRHLQFSAVWIAPTSSESLKQDTARRRRGRKGTKYPVLELCQKPFPGFFLFHSARFSVWNKKCENVPKWVRCAAFFSLASVRNVWKDL